MNVQDTVYRASRWIGDKTRIVFTEGSEITEPTAGELWDKVSPRVDNALTIYGKMESAPDSTWNPFADSKKSLKKELDEILDALLEVLEMCGAAGYRKRIRNLQADIATSKSRIGECREQMLSAPTEASLNPIEGLWTGSREGLEDQIADEKDRIAEREGQIESLKAAFRKHLQDLGVDVSPKTTDSFLLEVEDGIVSIAAVIANIGRITEQLQRLVDESGESPSQTKRYYGVYVLLVLAVDRIEKHFVSDIDNVFIPKFRWSEEKARQNIAVLQKLMSGGRSKELLLGNISASETTINACRVFSDTLRDQGRRIADRNIETERTLAEAAITYKTVLLSLDVGELIGQCQAAFRALRELKLPSLRTFQNAQLNDEMRQLSERVVEEK
jgi:hypothetical protein